MSTRRVSILVSTTTRGRAASKRDSRVFVNADSPVCAASDSPLCNDRTTSMIVV